VVRIASVLGVLLAALVIPVAAHAASSCGTMGETGDRVSVDHEGSLYYVTTPETYSADKAWPLVIGLHGDEGDPAMSVNFFWRTVPDGTFIFVAPKAPNASGSWYEEQASNSEWMDSLVDALLSRYNVDLDRVYLWGLSGGAVFSSRYVMDRQDVFAAVEFNMGGSGRQYQEPQPPACKIPARFVVSTTDFLRDNALAFFDLLTENGHETVWVDADCQDHCFDQEQAGPVARDWLLSHTLCGHTPSPGCDGMPNGAGMGAGGSANGSAGEGNSSGTPGAAGMTGGGQTNGGAPGLGGSGLGGAAMGPAPGGSEANPGAPGSMPSADGGCACSVPSPRSSSSLGIGSLLLLGLLARRSRTRH
jgi:MYXO-CTERM domain-containing protein